jgi:hypothetical protein
LPWLKDEFGWTDRTALNFIRVYGMAQKSERLSDLSFPMESLYLLAAPSTPEEVREDAVERAENGERPV